MSILFYFAILFALWFFPAYFAGNIAAKKGRSFFGFFFLSIVFSPIVGLIAAAIAMPMQVQRKEEFIKVIKSTEHLDVSWIPTNEEVRKTGI